MRMLKSRLEINSCIGVRYRCHEEEELFTDGLEMDEEDEEEDV